MWAVLSGPFLHLPGVPQRLGSAVAKHFKTTGWRDGGTDTGTAEAITDMEYEKEDLK